MGSTVKAGVINSSDCRFSIGIVPMLRRQCLKMMDKQKNDSFPVLTGFLLLHAVNSFS